MLPTSHYGFGTFSTATDVTFDDGSYIGGLESFTCGVRNTDTFVLGARLVTPQVAWPAPASTGLGKQGGSPIIEITSADPSTVDLEADAHDRPPSRSGYSQGRRILVRTLANSASAVAITAADACARPTPTPVQGSIDFVANMQPAFRDVDLGLQPSRVDGFAPPRLPRPRPRSEVYVKLREPFNPPFLPLLEKSQAQAKSPA